MNNGNDTESLDGNLSSRIGASSMVSQLPINGSSSISALVGMGTLNQFSESHAHGLVGAIFRFSRRFDFSIFQNRVSATAVQDRPGPSPLPDSVSAQLSPKASIALVDS